MLPHVVIIGGGFGGLSAARALGNRSVRVTVIDRSNHHLFQPLLYQVATAGLAPSQIALPIRSVLRAQKNTEVLLGEVVGVDSEKKTILLNSLDDPEGKNQSLSYDFLVIATGANHSYFGHDEWEKFAPGLKNLNDATRIRQKILLAFEAAEREDDPAKKQAWLNFTVIGGGPTGVELAGAIAELSHFALASDFRHLDPKSARIILLEAGPQILAAFPKLLAEKAKASLERLGVEVHSGTRVEKVDPEGVVVAGKRIDSRMVIWAAGVVASPAGKWLGAETDRAGRVIVGGDLSLPGHPEIFVIGDTASAKDRGRQLPGLAAVAMQQGRYVAQLITGNNPAARKIPFRYFDKGNLATVGRKFAVCDIGNGKIKLSGFPAWLTWLAVHIYYLIGFRNRVVVLMDWAWSYFTFQRGARLITTEKL